MNTVMPDIAHSTLPQAPRRLERVGMSKVDVPVLLWRQSAQVLNSLEKNSNQGSFERTPALAGGFVSLDQAEARGIHMSRIYRILAGDLPSKPIDSEHLSDLLEKLLESHAGISNRAEIIIQYSHLASMPALISGLEGWRKYPVFYRAQKDRTSGKTTIDLGLRVTYSSTCPCSAALARQLNQNKFAEAFGKEKHVESEKVLAWLGEESNVGGEPHAQRSFGTVVLRFDSPAKLPSIEALAAHVETHLGTPVQTAVKREDEQEFARLNARNLMFSEDAARKIALCLDSMACKDFIVNVTHFESLHPYDVLATATKGVPGGFSADDLFGMPGFIEG
jgi:GTP cyclohydrolase I